MKKLTVEDVASDSRLVCPSCAGPCKVINSRITFASGFRQRNRRYKCIVCGCRFSSLERIMSASITHKYSDKKEN